MNFDLRILGALFLLWGGLGLSIGVLDGNGLDVAKAIITLMVGVYIYAGHNKIISD